MGLISASLKRLSVSVAVASLLWPAVALAALITQETAPPVWYGDGETAAFHRALHGGEAFSPEEEQRIKAMAPPKDYNRFYVRYNIAMGRKNLSNITNLSDGSYPQHEAAVNQTSVRNNQRNSLIAIGYDWNPARFDIEYVWTKSFRYIANPVFKPPAPSMSLNARISNKVLLANFYWDYRHLAEHVYPYLVFSAGGVYNTVDMDMTNPQAGRGLTPSGHNFSLAFGGGAGLRLGVTKGFFIDLHFRYVKAGRINFRPEPSMYLRGDHSFYWYGLGLMYLL